MRILIVEDEEMVARSVARALKMSGHASAHAQSVAQALQMLQAGEPFDAVITDLRLGAGGNGLEIIRWVRANAPTLRCILATAATPHDFVEDPPNLLLLRKPFDAKELNTAIGAA